MFHMWIIGILIVPSSLIAFSLYFYSRPRNIEYMINKRIDDLTNDPSHSDDIKLMIKDAAENQDISYTIAHQLLDRLLAVKK